MSTDAPDHATCGCCTPVVDPTLTNAPGAPHLHYRIGTHGTFLARMVELLPFHEVALDGGGTARPLAALTTRDATDPSIAMLDAWAVIGDILTFYQERIANEGYLGTAEERRSIHELAAMIGYRLKPGVAASTVLAFTLDPPAQPPPPTPALPPPVQHPTPTRITLAAGTKVQSVPGPGQLPQMFETIEAIEARVAWNAIRPKQLRRQYLGVDTQHRLVWHAVTGPVVPCHYFFVDTATANLDTGNWLVVRVGNEHRDPSDPVSAGVSTGLALVRVHGTEVDRTAGRTKIVLENAAHVPPPFALPAQPAGEIAATPLPLDAATVRTRIVERTWDDRDLAAQIALQNWDRERLVAQVGAIAARIPAPASAWVQRKTASAFGANAPAFATLPEVFHRATDWDAYPRSIWKGADGQLRRNADLFLDRVVDGLAPGGWIVLAGPESATAVFQIDTIVESSLAEYGISGKATGLRLRDTSGNPLTDAYKTGAGHVFTTRETAIALASDALPVGAAPIEEPVGTGGSGVDRVVLDTLVLDLAPGRVLAVSGTALDTSDTPLGAPRSEIAVVARVEHVGGVSILHLDAPLVAAYDRATLGFCANVARATHGETVANEIMGSGDGGVPHRALALKRPPLTLVSAPTASGTASTLEVRVNGVAWHEVPTLLDAGPAERVFEVATDDEGKSAVVFGDGLRGARPPTGRDNLIASYRTGMGLLGNVAAGTLTLLQSRPLGLRAVTNPAAALGGEDPEPTTAARRNAPRTVRTLDRIVSLADYEDFARGFAGIGKARGVALWDGDGKLVHVTVAGVDGAPVPTTSDLYRNLVAAIAELSDGIERFAVGAFMPRQFVLHARLRIDPDRVDDDVLAAARDAISSAYSFAARDLARPVTESEVVATLLGVPGVATAELTRLHRSDRPSSVEPVIAASDASWNVAAARVDPAELLVLLPTGLELLVTT